MWLYILTSSKIILSFFSLWIFVFMVDWFFFFSPLQEGFCLECCWWNARWTTLNFFFNRYDFMFYGYRCQSNFYAWFYACASIGMALCMRTCYINGNKLGYFCWNELNLTTLFIFSYIVLFRNLVITNMQKANEDQNWHDIFLVSYI